MRAYPEWVEFGYPGLSCGLVRVLRILLTLSMSISLNGSYDGSRNSSIRLREKRVIIASKPHEYGPVGSRVWYVY